MILSELWRLYETDKRSPKTLKAYALQHKMLMKELGDLNITENLTSNPSLKLRETKMDKRIPKFLIEEDVIHLKIACQSLKERALLEFFYSTGCRVGEVEKINIEDLNWENCSAIVDGKGSKQREVYFTTECKVWLRNI